MPKTYDSLKVDFLYLLQALVWLEKLRTCLEFQTNCVTIFNVIGNSHLDK